MRSHLRSLFLMVSAVSVLAACGQDLTVTNPNNGDIGRALARPADVENLLAGGFNQVAANTVGGNTENLNVSFQVMSLENYTGLANFNMGPRAGLPRTPILNFANNPGSASVANDFNGLSRLTRSTTLALERLAVPGFTLGSAAQDIRTRSYGRFVLGLALGNLAMSYDSSAIVVPGAAATPSLASYDSVGRVAIRFLDSALVDANNPIAAGTGGFPLPAVWLNLSSGAVSAPDFVRIIRSYRARIRAEVARTPTERAAVDWPAVIADATNGITADMNIAMNPATGWTHSWVVQHYVGTNWHVMTPFIIGMADTTGAQYEAWLNQPLLTRTPFLIRTPDKRFPSGNTRALQNTASNGGATGSVPLGNVYFRNRLSADDGAANDGTWGFSWYDHARFQAFQNAARIGNFPHMTVAEMWALIAEGSIRTGDFATAALNIDRTRVSRGGLPSLVSANITSLTQDVPGGSACVPRIPVRTGTTFTTRCGNILEAMKWEKRMEIAFISYGAWYFDSRGWGDLPEGTPQFFPVPWQERDVRLQTPSNVGGVGQSGGAVRGTYGFP
jgi:starch-binding outer membrane protein, SusD/RagB family